jgi:hypothetical protein
VPRGTLYPQKSALTSPTSGCRSIGIVRSLTQTMEFFIGRTVFHGDFVRGGGGDLDGHVTCPGGSWPAGIYLQQVESMPVDPDHYGQ